MSTDKESGTDKEGVETQDPPDIQGRGCSIPFRLWLMPGQTIHLKWGKTLFWCCLRLTVIGMKESTCIWTALTSPVRRPWLMYLS